MPSNQVIRVAAPGLHAAAEDGSVAAATLRDGIAQIQAELKVSPTFPPEVEQAAAEAARSPRLPDLDRTDLPFVTIDPPGSMDLDQAMHLTRGPGDGFTVHYAIADVAAFVTPDGPVDAEAHARGESLYGADSKIPLHPTVLSEGAASLLPDQVRPALLWTVELDAHGNQSSIHVERARVRSVAKLDYAGVQQMIETGSAPAAYTETLELLKTVGELRIAIERARGGVDLPLPDQEIQIEGDSWHLEYRSLLDSESWNAQISLLTGFGAASLMVGAKVGLLRTLPPPDPRDVDRLRRTARGLRVDWPADQSYPDMIRTLDPARPNHAAMVVACTRLLRGSGYAAFNGELPELTVQSALAAQYAHVTAPLRRLIDRYAGEICVAICAKRPVPAWVLAKLDRLPEEMAASGHRSGGYERAILDLVEAGVLAPRVGEQFDGVIVEAGEGKDHAVHGSVTIQDPAVEAPVTGASLPVGEDVKVTLARADVATRKVQFTLP